MFKNHKLEAKDYKPEIIRQLKNISKNPPPNGQHDWLRFLHQRYTERFLKDNDRIWTVSSIFIPLSLAGLASIKEGNFISTLLLGMGSIGLIDFWFKSAEKHRATQEKNRTVFEAIELHIGLDSNVVPLEGKWATYKVYKGRQIVRRLVIFVWIVAIIGVFAKCVVEGNHGFQTSTLVENSDKIGKSLLGIKEEPATKRDGKVTIVGDVVNP